MIPLEQVEHGLLMSQCLIEPVWNENDPPPSGPSRLPLKFQRLIEPVWNENNSGSSSGL